MPCSEWLRWDYRRLPPFVDVQLVDTQLRRRRLQLFLHQASSLLLFLQRFHRRRKLYLHCCKVYLDFASSLLFMASSLLFSCDDSSKLTYSLIEGRARRWLGRRAPGWSRRIG